MVLGEAHLLASVGVGGIEMTGSMIIGSILSFTLDTKQPMRVVLSYDAFKNELFKKKLPKIPRKVFTNFVIKSSMLKVLFCKLFERLLIGLQPCRCIAT
jgi:hypothetical protein